MEILLLFAKIALNAIYFAANHRVEFLLIQITVRVKVFIKNFICMTSLAVREHFARPVSAHSSLDLPLCLSILT